MAHTSPKDPAPKGFKVFLLSQQLAAYPWPESALYHTHEREREDPNLHARVWTCRTYASDHLLHSAGHPGGLGHGSCHKPADSENLLTLAEAGVAAAVERFQMLPLEYCIPAAGLDHEDRFVFDCGFLQD